MDRTKLKPAEMLAGIGGLLLLISLLFLKWYGVGGDVETPLGDFGASVSFSAWDDSGFFGTIANLIILAAAVVAVGLAVLKMASRSVSLPVAASAMTAAGGIAATALIVLRMVIRPEDGLDLKIGIFVALAGAVIQTVGGWMAMKEEGTSFGEAREQLSDSMGSSESGSAPPPPPPPPPSDPPAGGGDSAPPGGGGSAPPGSSSPAA